MPLFQSLCRVHRSILIPHAVSVLPIFHFTLWLSISAPDQSPFLFLPILLLSQFTPFVFFIPVRPLSPLQQNVSGYTYTSKLYCAVCPTAAYPCSQNIFRHSVAVSAGHGLSPTDSLDVASLLWKASEKAGVGIWMWPVSCLSASEPESRIWAMKTCSDLHPWLKSTESIRKFPATKL